MLLKMMTAREFDAWVAFEGLEGLPEERADLRSAIVAMVMANAWRGKNTPAFTPADFMPEFGPPEEPTVQTAEEQMAMMELAAARMEKAEG